MVFSKEEAATVLAVMTGTPRLGVKLLYGSGLRISEALRQVKDVDFGLRQLTARTGKGKEARDRSSDPRSGVVCRHHLDPSGANKAIGVARRRAGIARRVSAHTCRHSFAPHFLQWGPLGIQAMLGRQAVATAPIYTQLLQVRNPLDDLLG